MLSKQLFVILVGLALVSPAASIACAEDPPAWLNQALEPSKRPPTLSAIHTPEFARPRRWEEDPVSHQPKWVTDEYKADEKDSPRNPDLSQPPPRPEK